MTTLFVYTNEELQDVAEARQLLIFRALDSAQAHVWRAAKEDGSEKEEWRQVINDDVTEWHAYDSDRIVQVNLIGSSDNINLDKVYLVRFNTYHECDIWLGATTTLQAAKDYAESMLKTIDFSSKITWLEDRGRLILDEAEDDSYPCAIELTAIVG